MAHEWADREATLRSYELFAREVVPHFKGTLASLEGSRDWAAENRPEFIGAVGWRHHAGHLGPSRRT